MPHQYIERFTFFFQVFDKVYASSANHTFGPHPITACHLGVLEYQFVVYTESDADTVIFCQHIDAAACGAGMQIDHSILIAEVHGDHIRVAFQVGDTDQSKYRNGR